MPEAQIYRDVRAPTRPNSHRKLHHTLLASRNTTFLDVKMGALKYIEELQKRKQSDVLRFLLRVVSQLVHIFTLWSLTIFAALLGVSLTVMPLQLLRDCDLAPPTLR